MTLARAWSCLAGLLLLAGCPFASPGLRADTGLTVASVAGKPVPALHVTAGAELGSMLEPEHLPADVGVGYVLFLADPKHPVNGLYLDGAWLHRLGTAGWRLSLGGRAELLLEQRGALALGSGGAVRFALEAATRTAGDFSSSGGNTSGLSWMAGTYAGTAAWGVTAEAGVRRLPGAIFSYYGMMGVTIRLPAAAGVFVFIPFPR